MTALPVNRNGMRLRQHQAHDRYKPAGKPTCLPTGRNISGAMAFVLEVIGILQHTEHGEAGVEHQFDDEPEFALHSYEKLHNPELVVPLPRLPSKGRTSNYYLIR
mgnify:CR=1 FL=1|jgi:hypothetical protein